MREREWGKGRGKEGKIFLAFSTIFVLGITKALNTYLYFTTLFLK